MKFIRKLVSKRSGRNKYLQAPLPFKSKRRGSAVACCHPARKPNASNQPFVMREIPSSFGIFMNIWKTQSGKKMRCGKRTNGKHEIWELSERDDWGPVASGFDESWRNCIKRVLFSHDSYLPMICRMNKERIEIESCIVRG